MWNSSGHARMQAIKFDALLIKIDIHSILKLPKVQKLLPHVFGGGMHVGH